VGHHRPWVAVEAEAGGVIVFGLLGFGVGGTFYDRLLGGISVGGGRPGREGGVWTASVEPSHEFTFGVGMSFISYPLVLIPLV
jgi:hypothetical protein